MVLTDIQTGLSSFSELLTSQTYLNTFKTQSRDSLLSDGLGTRANSIWKMAQYVIAYYDTKTEPLTKYLAGWETLNRSYRNQILIIEVSKGDWQMYDAYGNLMGGNDYIKSFIAKKKTEARLLESFKPSPDNPLQVIYFGAPGTSKSTTIKRKVGCSMQHRITFHPDTDYSNFVGCYKPTKEEGSEEITYAFVEQTFIKAYVDAWKKLVDDSDEHKEVYLIIEEINRGNCAQIFGDLFQLLDRDDKGYSDYTIEPDSDLQRHLAKMFKGTNVPENIRDGIEMQLPPNMFIWATMNTSDQSLFPIDSAFKRRWEWKYLPIKDDHKGHIIRVDGQHAYDWWLFLDAINLRIEKLTELEDKQLGYWFAKPNKGKEISVERFVSKVVFYLWNDVFKDYGNDGNSPFNIKQGDDKRLKLKFTSFFDPEGNVLPDKVITFIEALGVPVNTGAAAPLTEGQQIPPDEQNEASGEPEATPDEQPEAPEQHVVEEPPVAYGSNQPASSPEPDDDDDDDDDEPEDEGGDMNDLLNELYPQK